MTINARPAVKKNLLSKEIAVALRDRHIYLVNADGGDLTRITGGTGAEWGTPLWQPQEEG